MKFALTAATTRPDLTPWATSILRSTLLRGLIAERSPVVPDLERQVADLDAAADTLVAPVDRTGSALSSLRDALAAGEPVRDLVAALGATAAYQAEWNHARHHLLELRAELVTARAQHVASVAPKLFDALNSRLLDVVAGYRTNKAVKAGVTTPEAAISAQLLPQWEAAEVLAGQYAELREAQRVLTDCGKWPANQIAQLHHHQILLAIANPGEVWPDYIRALSGVGPVVTDRYGGVIQRRQPWPEASSHTGFLRWLTQNPTATPWVPDPDTASARLAEHQRVAREFADDFNKPKREAEAMAKALDTLRMVIR